MPNCRNCGAVLPVGSLVCDYCETRQDIDLKGIHEYTVTAPESKRTCPRCNKPLATIDLDVGEKFLIERCNDCLGMFFDPGEVEALLDKSVSPVHHIDFSRLNAIIAAKRHADYPISYVKCPVCEKMMNRINFGSKSGVIIDKCREHGVWLDGGELRQLMEWTKAGGRLHHESVQKEKQKLEQMNKEAREKFAAAGGFGDPQTNDDLDLSWLGGGGGGDIISMLAKFVGFLVK